MIDIYASAVDEKGRFGVFFERDDETAYLYLLDLNRPASNQIVEALNLNELTATDVVVTLQWSPGSTAAGLFVQGDLTALFDLTDDAPYGRWATDSDKSMFLLQ